MRTRKYRPTTIGTRLQSLRRRRKLTQAQLGAASGVHWTTIARIETGRRATPSLATVESLAVALGVSAARLIATTR